MFHNYTRFIIPVVNTLTSKVSITLWGNPFEPNMNLSDSSINFKFMSDFKEMILTKMKSDIFLRKLPPITDAPTVIFMQKLEEIDY